MDSAEIAQWFDAYLADFAALGRGDVDDVDLMLTRYGVPLILTTDAGCQVLDDEDQVRATAQQQVDALRAAGYDRSDVLAATTTVLNGSSALHRGRFARVRADGSEIATLEATYLITEGPAGLRISAIAIRSSP